MMNHAMCQNHKPSVSEEEDYKDFKDVTYKDMWSTWSCDLDQI